MAKDRSFKRPQRQRTIGRKVIIACEGKETERGYFEAIRKSANLPTVQVYVVPHAGSDPRNVVLSVRDAQQLRKREGRWLTGDTAWAVFDGDEHLIGNPGNWNDALQLARSNGINLAISNPCFELWYLLHYQDQSGNLHRDTARRFLKAHIPDYEKASVLYPDKLKHLTDDARERARKLEYLAKTKGLDEYTNPCTHVWKLVESLLKLEKEVAGNT